MKEKGRERREKGRFGKTVFEVQENHARGEKKKIWMSERK